MTEGMRYQQAEDLLVGYAGDEVLMMNVEHGTYHGLNATASRIWELLAVPSTIAEISATLQREFRIDGAACDDAVRRFVDELTRRKLIRSV